MKKITLLLLLLLFAISFSGYAQLTEDFETDSPSGWTFMQTETDDPGWVQTTGRANSGAASFYHDDADTAAESTSWMISPAHTVSTDENLSFFYNNNFNTYSVESGVWVSNASGDPIANPSDFSEVFDIDANFSEDVWVSHEYDLSSYVGQTIYVAFKYRGDFADEIYIDDFSIAAPPSCVPPSSLTAAVNSLTEVEISWTAGGTETAWEYVLQPLDTGEPTASGTATTSNPLSLSGLSLAPNTGYEIYLRANCGGDYSSWVQFAFLTSANCVSNTDVFVHDFQAVILGSVLDAACWSLSNGGDTNTWSLIQDDLGNIFWNLLYSSSAHDDYLYSPTISVVDGVTDGFNFKGWNPNTTWPEVIDVLVVDAADNSVLGTLVTDLNLPEPDATTGGYTVFTYDLSAYEGQDVKIAFHSTTTDQNAARIDDFTIDAFATLGTATNTLEGFTLYPTIVKEELNFRSQNKVAAITVFNLLGQKVFSGAPNANNSSVNLSNLRPGLYLVKVKSGNSIGSYKIIKE
jgi:hypothetical protein